VSAEDFNNALQLAADKGIRVAYSNQAFELWYLLHFHYYNTAISRQDYNNRLGELLNRKYVKNSPDMYEILIDKQPMAIDNAERLIQTYRDPNPANDDPSTTVHLLVEQLNQSSRP
jgi:hypothetical protein